MSHRLAEIEKQYAKPDLPHFNVGDHVSVGVLIREAAPKGAKKQEERTRVQNFIGDVIALGGEALGRAFTVRRVVQGEGVERTFQLHSPLVTEVKVIRHGDVRRAKLYDLRNKSGKSARIKERRVTKADAEAASAKAKARADAKAAKADAVEAERKSKSDAES